MTELLPRHRYTEYTDAPLGHYARSPEAIGLDRTVPPLRRTEDGRIDYDHYLRIAREERAAAALDIVRAIARGFSVLFNGVIGGRRRLGGPRHI